MTVLVTVTVLVGMAAVAVVWGAVTGEVVKVLAVKLTTQSTEVAYLNGLGSEQTGSVSMTALFPC